MNSLTLRSPSKINLYLRVTGRRSNGYHELVTLFHRISLFDQMELRKKKAGFDLKCSNPNLACDETNLITKAYRLLKQFVPDLPGVSVKLIKKIPLAAGLGGGSGNAATFLLGMNKLYQLKLSRKKLVQVGKKLGADVAFFLYEVNQALGLELGDKIKPWPVKKGLNFILVISDKGLSTKMVYQNLPKKLPSVSLTKEMSTVRILRKLLDRKDFKQTSQFLINDLESVAISLRPSIQKTIRRLKQVGLNYVRMSGSGPTVFAILSDRKQAGDFCRRLRRIGPGLRVISCQTF